MKQGRISTHKRARGRNENRPTPLLYFSQIKNPLEVSLNIMNTLILFLLPFIATVESNNNPYAIGDNGHAVGILQIHPSCVYDVNRITGNNYTLDDRLNNQQSMAIFTAYLTYYGTQYERRTGKQATAEILARIWNGGPQGYNKPSTLRYWYKVQRYISPEKF